MVSKLFIGIPVYGSVPAGFLQSITRLVGQLPFKATIRIKDGDSLVTRARNHLTADFLATDCSHLLFIDSDLIFDPDDVVNVCSHEEPLVGGIYPLKRDGDLVWCGNGLLADKPPVIQPDGLQRVRYVGTGFMCISREVFATMLARDLMLKAYTTDEQPHRLEYDYWRVGVIRTADARPRYLSEDWFFCQRWLDLGGNVHADTRVVLQHVGTAIYPLQSQRATLATQQLANSLTH